MTENKIGNVSCINSSVMDTIVEALDSAIRIKQNENYVNKELQREVQASLKLQKFTSVEFYPRIRSKNSTFIDDATEIIKAINTIPSCGSEGDKIQLRPMSIASKYIPGYKSPHEIKTTNT